MIERDDRRINQSLLFSDQKQCHFHKRHFKTHCVFDLYRKDNDEVEESAHLYILHLEFVDRALSKISETNDSFKYATPNEPNVYFIRLLRCSNSTPFVAMCPL